MRLKDFRVENYRSIKKTDWIDITSITAFVGQNEAGKSNLCEALYRLNPFVQEVYNIEEDWPLDDWSKKNNKALVCEARFTLDDPQEVEELFRAVNLLADTPALEATESAQAAPLAPPKGKFAKSGIPQSLILKVSAFYDGTRKFTIEEKAVTLDQNLTEEWAKKHLPKCVFIKDYDFPGSQVELPQLAERAKNGWASLSPQDQIMMIILRLAEVDVDEFIQKGASSAGRTQRSFDKRQASYYLSEQFSKLWGQKRVKFEIDIDATTLNILVQDEGYNMPVRLDKRSTGFRWHVAFAWKLTHATKGDYKNCIILLEEPGIHLHYAGHKDLLKILNDLSATNTIIYTTHIATMLDPACPERIRIVEVQNHHTKVVQSVVSSQRIPMMLIETRLGLSPDMTGLLGNRQTLVVEGGTDVLILQKLSGLLQKEGKEGLSNRIYLWPAQTASMTPMYAGFLVGQKFDAGVLLDSDEEGKKAKDKINDLYLSRMKDENQTFRIFMLGDVAKIGKTDAAIEDIFPDEFYLGCVNEAYGLAIKMEDLPVDGSDQIAKRVEIVLKQKYNKDSLDKKLISSVLLRRFDSFTKLADIPEFTVEKAETLFKKINASFDCSIAAANTNKQKVA